MQRLYVLRAVLHTNNQVNSKHNLNMQVNTCVYIYIYEYVKT